MVRIVDQFEILDHYNHGLAFNYNYLNLSLEKPQYQASKSPQHNSEILNGNHPIFTRPHQIDDQNQ